MNKSTPNSTPLKQLIIPPQTPTLQTASTQRINFRQSRHRMILESLVLGTIFVEDIQISRVFGSSGHAEDLAFALDGIEPCARTLLAQ